MCLPFHAQAPPPVAQGPSGLLAPPSGPQPHWVAAARLGTALQASKVVANMHAAADRERRLVAAAAVARQQLDLGLSDAAMACGTGSQQQQQLQSGAQEQLQQMAKLTQEVVEQNQLLQQAMTQQQAQLSQHQVCNHGWILFDTHTVGLLAACSASVEGLLLPRLDVTHGVVPFNRHCRAY